MRYWLTLGLAALVGAAGIYTVALQWPAITPIPSAQHWDVIASRDDPQLNGKRFPLYRVRVPNHWQRGDAPEAQSLAMTTEPLCSYTIPEQTGPVYVTIHNFPCDSIAERVDPSMQTARWQQQLEPSDPLTTVITPINSGGFIGLQLRACGFYQQAPTAMIAWSMQLAAQHFCNITATETAYNRHFCRQRRADYTIKAMGSPASIKAAAIALADFMASFELVQELPPPL